MCHIYTCIHTYVKESDNTNAGEYIFSLMKSAYTTKDSRN